MQPLQCETTVFQYPEAWRFIIFPCIFQVLCLFSEAIVGHVNWRPKKITPEGDTEEIEVKPDLEKPANSNELNKSEEQPLDDKKESNEENKK